MMQGLYSVESLTGNDMIESKPKAKNCHRGQPFRPAWSRQHGVGSNEKLGWSTDHLLNADGDDLRWTQYGLAMIFPRECFCPQFPYRGNDMIFWIFLLPFVTSFACDISQSTKNCICIIVRFCGVWDYWNSKLKNKTTYTENLTEKLQNLIKIFSNPGLA